jgi:hypothetical protein
MIRRRERASMTSRGVNRSSRSFSQTLLCWYQKYSPDSPP